jgi:hypothetical protein
MPEVLRISDPHVSQTLSLPDQLRRAVVPGFFLRSRFLHSFAKAFPEENGPVVDTLIESTLASFR